MKRVTSIAVEVLKVWFWIVIIGSIFLPNSLDFFLK